MKHWSLHREPGESLELHCNIQYCCRLVGVQFSEMKCQNIGKFLEKEKEPVCLNVAKVDTGADNATYVAHRPEGQIFLLEICTCDPKQNHLTLKCSLTVRLALLRAEDWVLWSPKVLSILNYSVLPFYMQSSWWVRCHKTKDMIWSLQKLFPLTYIQYKRYVERNHRDGVFSVQKQWKNSFKTEGITAGAKTWAVSLWLYSST